MWIYEVTIYVNCRWDDNNNTNNNNNNNNLYWLTQVIHSIGGVFRLFDSDFEWFQTSGNGNLNFNSNHT